MVHRVLTLLRARMKAQGWDASGPAALLAMQAAVAALMCSLVRGDLPPFAYGFFALTIAGVMLAIPLLGEFSVILRSDPASRWVASLPVRPADIRLARTLQVLFMVGLLALATLVPAVLLAPTEMGLVARLVLLVAGLAQALCIAALLLGLHAVLGERAEGLLVLAQTLLLVGAIVGFLLGIRHVPALAETFAPGSGSLTLLPPTWFALPLAPGPLLAQPLGWVAPLATLVALLLLAFLPAAPAVEVGGGGGLLGRLLAPLRVLAARTWVRPEERGIFELVYDALPAEREFVLRTYPMVGIPLAFLWVAAAGQPGAERDAALALILFTPATYLPILLAHVPVTATPAARWIVDSAPIEPAVEHAAARKAVCVRFLAPLYLVLGGLTLFLSGTDLFLRLVLPGALVTLLLMRLLYGTCVSAPPLSVTADEVGGQISGAGMLFPLAFGLTILAVVAHKMIETPANGLFWSGALLVLYALVGRVPRR